MIISVIILFIVFALIAIRQIGTIKMQIWQVMFLGALAAIVTGQIGLRDALSSINLDVIMFLFGMFIIGEALERSGYLSYLASKVFKNSKNSSQAIFIIIFGSGLLAAILMNDTIAIIGTPIVLMLAFRQHINPKLLLLALAFSITIGTVMSPIGNPQNLLIALNGGIREPFIAFTKYLLIPTIINLFITYFILKFFYKNEFNKKIKNDSRAIIKDKHLANLSKYSLIMIIILIFLRIILSLTGSSFDIKFTYMALLAALPVLLFSNKRLIIIKNIDWYTLIFFASMFILMQSVWNSEFFQSVISSLHVNLLSISVIFFISIILSQFISNVPMVALYISTLTSLGATSKEYLALAAGSTIAGNLFILGAASNVIIIQNSEKKTDGNTTITFWEFARIGIPLTILNVIVYLLWFLVV